jgi:hypothetical protein
MGVSDVGLVEALVVWGFICSLNGFEEAGSCFLFFSLLSLVLFFDLYS